MDIKLDFVPPTLINFVARQIIGSGHKLYQKAVGSVATSDEDYRQALEGSLYARIREGLDPVNKLNTTLVGLNEEKHGGPSPAEHADSVVEIRPVTEIVEEEMEQTSVDTSISQIQPIDEHMSMICPEQSPSSSSANEMQPTIDHARKVDTYISPEVERALRMLDKAIAVVRGRGFSNSNQSDGFSNNQETRTPEAVLNSCLVCNGDAPKNNTDVGTKPSNAAQDVPYNEDFRNTRMASAPEGGNGDQGELTLSDDMSLASNEKLPAESTVTVTRPPTSESMRKVCDEESLGLNGFHGLDGHQGVKSMTGSKEGKKKKQGFPCCLNLSLFRN